LPRCMSLLAHSCPGPVPLHVRSWRKPTPHSQDASVGQHCLGAALGVG
jgi:hypothetical protein